jgi:hypothetical protein
MIDEKLFLKIADNNFHIFEVLTIKDIETIQKLYPRKEMIRDLFKSNISSKNIKITLPEKITIEIFLLLSEFCIKNKIEPLECCALFKIISDVLKLFAKKLNKNEIYENFKKFVLTFAMNRFSVQIGILKKETIYLITDFFIEVIYKRFFMIHYCLTNKDWITLETRESVSCDLPKIEDLSLGNEIIPRNVKILRQYFESHRPKTELEQKIEMVLEFERDKLDKKMEKIFQEQDSDFNAKIEELFKKKK